MLLSHPRETIHGSRRALPSYASLRAGHSTDRQLANVGVIEWEGTPEMVLEVVSDSSVVKDCITQPWLYHAMGVDSSGDDAPGELVFELFRCAARAMRPCGCPMAVALEVFRRDFQLTQATDPLGNPLYTLLIRASTLHQ